MNLPRYIDSSEPEDIQDIDGHLRGGIPNRDIDALERYWKIIPAVRWELFKPLRENYSQLTVPLTEIKQTIFGNREFTAFNEQVNGLLCKWIQSNTTELKAFDKEARGARTLVPRANQEERAAIDLEVGTRHWRECPGLLRAKDEDEVG